METLQGDFLVYSKPSICSNKALPATLESKKDSEIYSTCSNITYPMENIIERK